MSQAVRLAKRRSWQHLAKERLQNTKPAIPLGKCFWPLSPEERGEIAQLFERDHVRQLATMLRSRKDDAPVTMLDAAYWKKGCSSLGKLRFCVLLGVGDKQAELCLMDLKEAVEAAAPSADVAEMPDDQAQRVVEGARHLSPYLGERMRAVQMFGRSIFVRELLPQDLKIELETLTRDQAMEIAHFLVSVVGKAHARQMDEGTRSKCANELGRARTGDLKAPSWLWSSVVDLLAIHEQGIPRALSLIRPYRVALVVAARWLGNQPRQAFTFLDCEVERRKGREQVGCIIFGRWAPRTKRGRMALDFGLVPEIVVFGVGADFVLKPSSLGGCQ